MIVKFSELSKEILYLFPKGKIGTAGGGLYVHLNLLPRVIEIRVYVDCLYVWAGHESISHFFDDDDDLNERVEIVTRYVKFCHSFIKAFVEHAKEEYEKEKEKEHKKIGPGNTKYIN